MLAWIGHRDKQYHLIYSSQPGLWLSVLNRGLPSTQCIHMANTVLVEWSNFFVGQSCLFSNCPDMSHLGLKQKKHPVCDKCTDNAYLNWC